MQLFDYMGQHGHEQVAFWLDKDVDLKAIIAIHDTTLGPALGGTRMWPYATMEDALIDVLRLSEGMTYKAAVAGLDLGGGKAVIIGDPATEKSPALFESYGRFVDSLGGRYITAEDVGTTVADMVQVSMTTKHVTGLPESHGGSGDPSPLTAFGVYKGIKACTNAVFGTDSLPGKTVAVQGLGKVGYSLADYLRQGDATVVAADINKQALDHARRELDIEIVDPDEIYQVKCDIFAPCALGAVINDTTIPQLRARIVAGSANNQLAEDRHGYALRERGILYAPDFVINAGGLINVAAELKHCSPSWSWNKVANIYTTVTRIIEIAREQDVPTHVAALQLARRRIADPPGILEPV
jgi:leucine dehydrogenase